MRDIIMNIAMLICGTCTVISYLPQIIKLIKTKKSEDISILSWTIFTITSISYLVYSICLGRFDIIAQSACEAFLILLTLILVNYYNYKNRK